MAYRNALAQAVAMGSHEAQSARVELPPKATLVQITFHVWHFGDKTMMTAVGIYEADGVQVRRNIGADILDYKILDLPSLPQVVWAIGDEIRHAYKELSHPKQ